VRCTVAVRGGRHFSTVQVAAGPIRA
ncbi:hypothetical protein Tco_1395511, partial [Tanacetum coccineum]